MPRLVEFAILNAQPLQNRLINPIPQIIGVDVLAFDTGKNKRIWLTSLRLNRCQESLQAIVTLDLSVNKGE